MEWLHLKRVGRLAAFELSLPIGAVETESDGHWNGGVGGLTLAGKVVVYQSLRRGLIAALGHELVLPTGDEDRGLGSGTVVFAPFAAITQLLPANAAFHAQLIGEIPTDRDRSDPRIELRTAFAKTFSKALGEREWSPMFEVLARPVFDKGGRDIQVDLVPQFEVSLSRTKHVTLAVGVVVPVTDSSERATQLAIDLKWDWFTKKFFEGW